MKGVKDLEQVSLPIVRLRQNIEQLLSQKCQWLRQDLKVALLYSTSVHISKEKARLLLANFQVLGYEVITATDNGVMSNTVLIKLVEFPDRIGMQLVCGIEADFWDFLKFHDIP